ncbi:MAG: hypothetical protein HY673_03570 [Chloroflexi bacterium]|nr:hypothetical protein [Chloroflexota bacterium]
MYPDRTTLAISAGLGFYPKKLLDLGWAGELTPAELACIKDELKRSPKLKRRWGFRPSARRLPESRIRAIARNGHHGHG